MFKSRKLGTASAAMLVLAGVGFTAMPGASKPAIETFSATPPSPIAPVSSLTVMSYNVEGLPAPARFGRRASLERIGRHLAEMRDQGNQPNVVLLQEAFSGAAQRIAGEAGYRFVATGPAVAAINHAPVPPEAVSFVAAASRLKGEDDGKWVGSGLRILSDYPIVKVDRLAFPEWACAGYDCLANKGAVIAWIAVPGSPRPVAFIDTHLNSRAASGVAKARADTAYRYQVAALRDFIASHVRAGSVAFLGGDFNNGKASVRWAAIGKGLLPSARNSLLDALADRGTIARPDRPDTEAIMQRHKDWLYYRGNSRWRVALTGFEVPFGRAPDGSMLSDHLGYEAHYRVGDGRSAA